MSTKLFKVLFLSLFLVVSNSCKKNTVTPDETETPAKATISADASDVKIMQAVLLTVANKKVEAEYYDAKLGTDSVKLVKVADDKLMFLVPEDMQAGSYSLFTPLAENILVFHVTQTQAIDHPDTYINDFVAEMNTLHAEILQQVDSLSKDTLINKSQMLNILKADQDSMNAAVSKFKSATAEEKKFAAMFIEANRAALDEIGKTLEDLRVPKKGQPVNGSHMKKGDCDDLEHFYKMRCLLRQFTFAIVKMSAPAILGGFTGSAVAFYYTGGTGTQGGAQAGAILGTLLFKSYVKKQLTIGVNKALEFGAVPFQMIEEKLADFSARQKSVMEFEDEKEKKVKFTLTMRNIDERVDATSKHDFIVDFIKAFKNLQKTWIDFYPDATTIVTLPGTKKQQIEPKKMEYMSVNVLNNPKVTGSLSGSPTDLKVTFKTDELTDQEFTFEINYSDGVYTNKATQEAVLKGKTFKLIDAKFQTIYILALFKYDVAETFYLSEDEKTPAQNIDYSKISIRNQVNSKVQITLTKNTSSFSIKMKHEETDDQFVFFDVYYGETKIQEVSAKAIKNDPCAGLTVTTSRSGKTITATATGGSGPYSYKLLNYFYTSPSFVSSNQIDLVYDGSYAVIVKDINGCMDTSDWACVDDVTITSMKTLQYDGTSTGRGLLEV
ncbi:MAG: SprB repeat-containing protein, partial [Bacteroidia bacterium]